MSKLRKLVLDKRTEHKVKAKDEFLELGEDWFGPFCIPIKVKVLSLTIVLLSSLYALACVVYWCVFAW